MELDGTDTETCRAFRRDRRRGSRLEGQDWGSSPPNQGGLGQREAWGAGVAARSWWMSSSRSAATEEPESAAKAR